MDIFELQERVENACMLGEKLFEYPEVTQAQAIQELSANILTLAAELLSTEHAITVFAKALGTTPALVKLLKQKTPDHMTILEAVK